MRHTFAEPGGHKTRRRTRRPARLSTEAAGGADRTREDTRYAGFGTVRPRVQIPGPRPDSAACPAAAQAGHSLASVADPDAAIDRGYESLYEEFDSPLMQQLRIEAYGEDFGQHSWVTASELESCGQGLGLTASSRLLDLGCGPGGPLSFVVRRVGCRAVGVDLSHAAIAAARARMAARGLDTLVLLQQADANEPIPF